MNGPGGTAPTPSINLESTERWVWLLPATPPARASPRLRGKTPPAISGSSVDTAFRPPPLPPQPTSTTYGNTTLQPMNGHGSAAPTR